MKILTLTTWADYNYGASLQAYALVKYLREQGHDAKLIKYLPAYQTRMYNFMWVNPESKASQYYFTRWCYRIAKFFQRMTTLRRKKKFDRFNFEIIPATQTVYHSFKELCENPPLADLYIVGSDQVWNVLYDAGRDPSFYLEFVKKGKIASYAASFSYLNIGKNEKERIFKCLSKFNMISVREYQGQELVLSMGLDCSWVLDPVFLLSLSEWNILVSKADKSLHIDSEKYLLVYDFEGNSEIKEFACRYAKIHKLEIYAIIDKYPLLYADKNFTGAGPIEFVKLIAQCQAFVSNSFHGTVFSIMYHKPFFVFNRCRHQVNSRMESLLKLFNLTGCMVNGDMEMVLNTSFDWNEVEKIKQEKVDYSKKYLKNLGV